MNAAGGRIYYRFKATHGLPDTEIKLHLIFLTY